MPRLTKRSWLFAALAVFAIVVGYFVQRAVAFPADTIPEGAYLRVVLAVTNEKPEDFFAYIEERADHAAFTIGNYRKKSLARARATFPKDALAPLEKEHGAIAAAKDGREVFGIIARREGWVEQLRRDTSGVAQVEIQGERATVVTVRGTRYAFRRRPGGIWGMTAFSAALEAEAERAARDSEMIEAAAADYEKVRAVEAR